MGLKKKNSDEEKEKNTMATLYPDLNDWRVTRKGLMIQDLTSHIPKQQKVNITNEYVVKLFI
jgi:hypothetical protein